MSEQLLASIAACAPFDADLEGTPLGEWIQGHGVNIDAQQATPHNDTLLMWAVRNGNPTSSAFAASAFGKLERSAHDANDNVA